VTTEDFIKKKKNEPSADEVPTSFMTAKMRENLTGWLFISPAMTIIAVFGLFPIGYAVYMSFFRWRVKQGKFFCNSTYENLGIGELNIARPLDSLRAGAQVIRDCFKNYEDIVGNWDGALLFFAGFLLLLFAYWVWVEAFRLNESERTRKHEIYAVIMVLIGALAFYRGIVNRAEVDAIFFFAMGVSLWAAAAGTWTQVVNRKRDDSLIIKIIASFILLGISLFSIVYGYERMINAAELTRDEAFLKGLVVTFYYAFGSVPIQLGLALILAYTLYQNIQGKETFRMIFFMPYITPVVAAAVVFRTIFNKESTAMANQFLSWFGISSKEWLYENEPFLNEMFGWNLEGFLAGPSMAMVSIIVFGIWTYVGYNTVIFLAGLGSIPADLYEAARVDGASNRHLFRYITLPMLSPITFYLSILAFIGTFKAFNHIYVMRVPFARDTVDTASVIIFDTFKIDREYGLATAQAITLFLIILALTQVQRSIFEKRVFYG
jgi:ABC-type sugar transport system permease subunit